MQTRTRKLFQGTVVIVCTMAMGALCGCDGFFVKPGSTTPGGTGTGSSINYAYVSNSLSGVTVVNGYNLANGSLAATNGSPYTLSFTPTAMAVNPANTFLYVATTAVQNGNYNGIYVFSIGSGGALASANGGAAVASGNPVSIDISPDGQWLVSLDSLLQQVTIYAVNSTTGTLTLAETLTYLTNSAAITPSRARFSPNGKWVVAALGLAGDLAIPFSTSTGVLSTAYFLITPPANSGDYGVVVDGNDYLYVARTGTVAAYALDASSPTTLISSATAGRGPHPIVLNSTDKDVYVGNQSEGTISGFSIAAGAAFTSLSGSPFAGPQTISALERDSSGKYVVAAGYGAAAVQLFTIGSSGALTLSSSVGAGTNTQIPTVLALTH